ncbi:hypothetical protein HYV50_05685 [Candidatus Pacearchaeota archaeon]|nr:hypothetical protein [Candidatus Pacearchaeota archaeon]
MNEKDLIKKIKEKRELKGISDGVVEELIDNYVFKYKIDFEKIREKEMKIIVKDIRAELRNYVGRFQKSLKDRIKMLENGNIWGMLKTHSSTAERLDFYPKLRRKIREMKVKSILDMGCGLNPVALAEKGIKYYACDINLDDLEIVERFFEKEKINGRVFICDVRDIKDNLPVGDLCFLLKVLDIIEKNKKKKIEITKKIFEKVKCKKFLISFSTKKLSGKMMNRPDRIWFEKLLMDLGLKFEKFESENEVFYLVEKS